MRHVGFATCVALIALTIAATGFAQGRGFRGGRGPDQDFVRDRTDFHFLLEHHAAVRREVKELENGVETVTVSDDQEVATIIKQHVAAMYARVEHNRPIRMRDPLFAELFRHADKITMKVHQTPQGVRVVETSDDAYVVELIKSHAKVVSGFAEDGFKEAHKTHPVPKQLATDDGLVRAETDATVFVSFDRVFIPALALTKQMNQAPATRAMDRLSHAWESRFVDRFRQIFRDDASWSGDISRISDAVTLARAELQAGKSKEAHEALEPVRDLLMHARRRNHFDYPLDPLSQFHATMEAIVKPAMNIKAERLTDTQWQQFERLAQQADQEWHCVEHTDFNLKSFGKSAEQQGRFPTMLAAEREAIDQLNRSFATRDTTATLKAAAALKPPFARVYMFFGDFPKPSSDERR